jgi:integrase
MNEWVQRYEAAMFVERGAKLGDLAEQYFADRRKEGKNVAGVLNSWKALRTTFEHLSPEDLNKPEEVEGETRTVCHRYARNRQLAGLSRETIHHELNCLRTILNWAAKPTRKLIPAQVGVWVPPRGRPRRNELSPVQFVRLLQECRTPHLRLFVLLAIFTAQRRAAILELTWDQVNFGKRTIDFRIADDDTRNILDTGSKKGRAFVDMPDSLCSILQEAYTWRRTGHVIEYAGAPIKDIKTALNKALIRAGIKGLYIGSHSLRKSVATWLADKSVDMRQIQKLCGHEHIDTTSGWYAGQSAGYLSDAVNILEDVIGANILEGADSTQKGPKLIRNKEKSCKKCSTDF